MARDIGRPGGTGERDETAVSSRLASLFSNSTLLVLFVVALVAFAQPASAAQVQIRHTTAEDFHEGALSNVNIEGSGESASVVYESELVDSFEDGDLSEYSGDVGSGFSTQDMNAFDGLTSLRADASFASIYSFPGDGLANYPDAGDVYRQDVQISSANPGVVNLGFATQEPGGNLPQGYYVQLDPENSEVVLYKDNPSNVLDSESVNVPTGTQISVSVTWTTGGSMSVNVRNAQTDSSISLLLATDSEYTDGGVAWMVEGDGDNVAWIDDARVGADEGTYTDAPFEASASEGYVDLTVGGSQATVEWQGSNDGLNWDTVDTSVYSSSGNYSASLPSTYSQYRPVVTFSAGSGVSNPGGSVSETGVLATVQPPNASNPSPDDNYQLAGGSVEFGVNVSDPDFGTAQGDEVTAELVYDGEVEATETVTENTTVNATVDIGANSSGEWHWRVTDRYGLNDTTETRSILLPDALEIRSAQLPHELLDNETFRVRFYDINSDEVVERYATDGTIPLSEVPFESDYIVTVDGSANYTYTSILVDSAIDQDALYLREVSPTNAQVVFELDDRTGDFPPSETRLYIESAISRDYDGDGDRESRYQIIAGGQFGGGETFNTVLNTDERYRLRIVNDEGQTRALGAYQPAGDERVVLPIGQVEIRSDPTNNTFADAELVEEDGEFVAQLTYLDTSEETTQITTEIVGPNGSTVYGPATVTGSYGAYAENVQLGSGAEGQSYVAYINVTRSGETESYRFRIGSVDQIANDWDMDQGLLQILGAILTVGLTGLVVINDPRGAALVGVVCATFLSLIGVFSIHPLALSFAGVLAVLGNLGRMRG